MSTTKYDHLPEQEKHAALAREEAAIKAEALRYHDKHRMTPAKVAKLTARHVVLALLAAFWLIPILWLVVTSFGKAVPSPVILATYGIFNNRHTKPP